VSLDFRIPLTYSAIDLSPVTREHLVDVTRRMHWQGVAKVASGVASISWQRGIEDRSEQERFVRAFTQRLIYGPALVRALRQDAKALVFTRENFLAILRIALVEMSEGDGEGDAFPDHFTRACLMANTLLLDEVTPPHPQGDARDLIASELRSIVLQPSNIHDDLGRADAFIRWAGTLPAEASTKRLRVVDDFLSFTQLSPDEFAAAAYITTARYTRLSTWDLVDQHGVAFDIGTWLHGVSDQRCVRQFFQLNAVVMDDARSTWRQEPSLSFAAAKPLWSHPIIDASAGLFSVPSPQLLMNKFGNGFYFTLFDGYKARSEPGGRALHMQFAEFWSEFFEDYVFERFRDGYSSRPDVLVRAEPPRPRGPGTDVIVIENGNIVFIEVVAKRLNLERSVVGLSDDAIEADLRSAIAAKMEQLHENITDFRDGVLLPQVQRSPGYRVFPVIVSPAEWPRIYALGWYIPKVLRENPTWFTDCEPLELLDVEEVERLESIAAAGNSITGLLDRKNQFARHDRFQSLHNYLWNNERSMLEGSTPSRLRGDAVAERIINLARSWT